MDKSAIEAKLTEAEKALTAAKADEADYAKFYVKTIKKLLDRGMDHVSKESARITKLQDGKLTEKKKKMFADRLNILASFTEKAEL